MAKSTEILDGGLDMSMAINDEKVNAGLRAAADRQQQQKPGDDLPTSVAEVLEVRAEELEAVADELEAKLGEIAEEHAAVSQMVGAAQARLALEGSGSGSADGQRA